MDGWVDPHMKPMKLRVAEARILQAPGHFDYDAQLSMTVFQDLGEGGKNQMGSVMHRNLVVVQL